jgi:hypothetical protein
MKRLLSSFLLLALFAPSALFAQSYTQELDAAGDSIYGSSLSTSGDLIAVIGSLISAVLGVLGIVLLVMLLYAGFLWMTAGGNGDQVGKAKTIMINSVIGLVILLASYSISLFVIGILQSAQLAA